MSGRQLQLVNSVAKTLGAITDVVAFPLLRKHPCVLSLLSPLLLLSSDLSVVYISRYENLDDCLVTKWRQTVQVSACYRLSLSCSHHHSLPLLQSPVGGQVFTSPQPAVTCRRTGVRGGSARTCHCGVAAHSWPPTRTVADPAAPTAHVQQLTGGWGGEGRGGRRRQLLFHANGWQAARGSKVCKR